MRDGLPRNLCRADGLGPCQAALYVLRHARRSSRSQRDHRSIYPLPQTSDLKVIRAEIIAPLGNTMRLVNYDETDVQYI